MDNEILEPLAEYGRHTVLPGRDEPDPERALLSRELWQTLTLAPSELPWTRRASWVLREVEGFSYAEIADVLDTTPTVVRGNCIEPGAHSRSEWSSGDERHRAGPCDIELTRGEAALTSATEQLRLVALPRTVEIADRVLTRTLATPRRARLVRGRPPRTYLTVSSLVLVSTLRDVLDTHLDAAAVGNIHLDIDTGDELRGLIIELFVQYGIDVLDAADHARELAREALTQVLGPAEPGTGDDLVVRLSHVHVSDVTVGDPHLTNPGDPG